MSTADTTAWRQRAERCDDRIRELRAEMARRDEQIAAVRTVPDAVHRELQADALADYHVGTMAAYRVVLRKHLDAALDGVS